MNLNKTSSYDFDLPDSLIAQNPLINREDSKFLILDSKEQTREHKKFSDIKNYLTENDVLVLNKTRVIPARLFGIKQSTGAKIELLLLSEKDKDIWECLVRPSKKIKVGDTIDFGNQSLIATCVETFDEGIQRFKLDYEGIFLECLEKLGTMPLPPYIKEQLKENERYQTVYSEDSGSVAAPTAGLHFTKEILEELKEKGIQICYVTLHVGLGTFRPISVDDVSSHKMHSEEYFLDQENALALDNAKSSGKNIVAVGTTTVRTLETIYRDHNRFIECSGDTDIFITPGFKFKAIDSLITNFHLPKSTLMMLVSAFAGYDFIMDSYEDAIEERYRFFSFGDSMFIKKGIQNES